MEKQPAIDAQIDKLSLVKEETIQCWFDASAEVTWEVSLEGMNVSPRGL